MGEAAVLTLLSRKSGRMIALDHSKVVELDLVDVLDRNKPLHSEAIKLARNTQVMID